MCVCVCVKRQNLNINGMEFSMQLKLVTMQQTNLSHALHRVLCSRWDFVYSNYKCVSIKLFNGETCSPVSPPEHVIS